MECCYRHSTRRFTGSNVCRNGTGPHRANRLFFYTDGLTEAMNAEGEEFGIQRFMHCIQKEDPIDSSSMLTTIRTEVEQHIGSASRSDDLSLLMLEVI